MNAPILHHDAVSPYAGKVRAMLDCSAESISVRRADPRAGTVAVHFPRFGFQISRPA